MYLIPKDFKRLIQIENLQQIIGYDEAVLNNSALHAQSEAVSYLVQKYLTDREFSDTNAYDPARIYKVFDRVYLDAFPYSSASTYQLGVLTQHGGNIYVSNTIIAAAEPWSPNHWIYLGQQYDIFNVPSPWPEFKLNTSYEAGTKVYYNGYVYTARQNFVAGYSHEFLLQQGNYANLPINNSFPGTAGAAGYWGTGSAYTVLPGTLYSGAFGNYTPQYAQTFQEQYTGVTDGQTVITIPALIGKDIIQIIKEIKPLLFSQYTWNKSTGTLILLGTSLSIGETLFILNTNVVLTSYVGAWVKGDDRNPQMIGTVVDIALYHVHKRISPRNIPDLRIKAYDDAKYWLKMCAKGEITANMQVIQPKQGSRIRYSGSIRNINSY